MTNIELHWIQINGYKYYNIIRLHYHFMKFSASQAFTLTVTGTFNPDTGRATIDGCIGCPSGQYCDSTGLSAPAGNCSEGFWCRENSTRATPTDGYNDFCPPGYYCPEGIEVAVPCPAGTYRQFSCES